MAVKVRERPAKSGRWWVFTDWKGKRSARFIPQGKRAAEEVAKRITEKLDLVETNQRNGVSFSFRELVLGRPDLPAPVMPTDTGPLFGPTLRTGSRAVQHGASSTLPTERTRSFCCLPSEASLSGQATQ